MTTEAWTHQVELGLKLAELVRTNMIGYLVMEERTGKSLTAIVATEQLNVNRVLIVTKKAAVSGWIDTLKGFTHTKLYTVINYHGLAKMEGSKFDLVILDEAHNYIAGLPAMSAMHKLVLKFTVNVPIIYLSATPCAQGPAYLYHQLALSNWSPWAEFSGYREWHLRYGIPYTKYVYKRQIPMFDRVKDDIVLSHVEHLFIRMTRAELGFKREPQDVLHYITLSDDTKHVYNRIIKSKVYVFKSGAKLIADSISKVRYSLHMLEGGVIKIDKKYLVLGNTEKVDFILEKWGDTKDLVIMYNFKAEKTKLEHHFKKALILQGTKYAEGIDLSDKGTLVIYSQDYSTARHTQRRARQANMNRDKPIDVHYLLVMNAISDEVYDTVSSNKRNYVDSLYKGKLL